MKLRQIFENIYQEASGVTDVAIIFGRFNPPHQGHAAAWRTASRFDEWFVGTNEGTVGPKDPLPFKAKVAAMKTIYPAIEGHLVAEQSWWTLAAFVYKKFGPVTLHIVTDEQDAKIFVPGLQDQNAKEGPHGYYNFKSIEWAKADRISSATDLRAAVAKDDPKAFERAAGVPANIVVAGRPFFELVKHYLTPYLHQAAEKEAAKAERARLKAEKEAAKADKLASKQSASQEEPETLAEKMQKLELELLETTEKKISKRQQQGTVGLNTFGDSERMNSDYTQYRLGMAVACADGTTPIEMNGKTWIGKRKSTHPYTQAEQDMLKQAYKTVGATYKDLNKGDMKSMELDTTYTVSPIAKPKKNKYGV
jgi:hypothetical protein